MGRNRWEDQRIVGRKHTERTEGGGKKLDGKDIVVEGRKPD